jgi:GNAT superfamily N-acetyltransferase
MTREYAREFYKRPDADKGACPVCNLCYAEYDSNDRKLHRTFHKAVVDTFDPRPNKLLAKEHAKHGTFVPVGPRSVRQLRVRLGNIGRAFKNEFGAGWIQYDQHGDDGHGFIIAAADGRALGGTTIRLREGQNGEWKFVMAWVWVAPAFRRQGLMRATWETAAKRFPGLLPEPPFSQNAAAFFCTRADVSQEVRDYAMRTLEAGATD